MHGTDGGLDMASLPLTKLIHAGAIVDVSDEVSDWDLIEPEHITSKVEVRKGDILIIPHRIHPLLPGPAEAGPGALFHDASGR